MYIYICNIYIYIHMYIAHTFLMLSWSQTFESVFLQPLQAANSSQARDFSVNRMRLMQFGNLILVLVMGGRDYITPKRRQYIPGI